MALLTPRDHLKGEASRIIDAARAVGLTIDGGNVLDLLADNLNEPLTALHAVAEELGFRPRGLHGGLTP